MKRAMRKSFLTHENDYYDEFSRYIGTGYVAIKEQITDK